MQEYHRPVLAQEVADFLVRDPSAAYLDATLGGGGHAALLLERLAPDGVLIALDRDPEAVERGRARFADDPRVRVILSPFSRLAEHCAPESLAGALFDLGVSSRQLDARERGFSFEPGGALDMRMGPDADGTALEWLRGASEEELATCFRRNADLERARALARRVKELLREAHAEAVHAGSDLLRRAVQDVYRPRDDERARLLARVFQAIRMEVNRELPEIREGLSAAVEALATGGRVCVLSYHSVEDRAVKELFVALERDCVCPPRLPVCQCGGNRRRLRKVIRRPLEASAAEVAANPRARSAKLRVMEKV
jgi:16S rRNA (cytosine1402-N4)-methyltransferase